MRPTTVPSSTTSVVGITFTGRLGGRSAFQDVRHLYHSVALLVREGAGSRASRTSSRISKTTPGDDLIETPVAGVAARPVVAAAWDTAAASVVCSCGGVRQRRIKTRPRTEAALPLSQLAVLVVVIRRVPLALRAPCWGIA
jgi:hypothetical protein